MRPDITDRVFLMKLNAPHRDIFAHGVLWNVVAVMYVVEFQKRGLPSAHIICILAESDAPRPTENHDDIVSAVLPDQEGNPALWRTVTTSTTHGPCGSMNPKSACAVDGVCSNGVPGEIPRRNDRRRRISIVPTAGRWQIDSEERRTSAEPMGRAAQSMALRKVQRPYQRGSL